MKFVVPHELLWFSPAGHKTNRILTLVHRDLFERQLYKQHGAGCKIHP